MAWTPKTSTPCLGAETTPESSAQQLTQQHLVESRRRPFWDFLGGASVIFDFAGTLTWPRVSTMKYRTDAEALAGDWYAVGDDLRSAMGRYPVPEGSSRLSS